MARLQSGKKTPCFFKKGGVVKHIDSEEVCMCKNELGCLLKRQIPKDHLLSHFRLSRCRNLHFYQLSQVTWVPIPWKTCWWLSGYTFWSAVELLKLGGTFGFPGEFAAMPVIPLPCKYSPEMWAYIDQKTQKWMFLAWLLCNGDKLKTFLMFIKSLLKTFCIFSWDSGGFFPWNSTQWHE
jgi:hypothetical protein